MRRYQQIESTPSHLRYVIGWELVHQRGCSCRGEVQLLAGSSSHRGCDALHVLGEQQVVVVDVASVEGSFTVHEVEPDVAAEEQGFTVVLAIHVLHAMKA